MRFISPYLAVSSKWNRSSFFKRPSFTYTGSFSFPKMEDIASKKKNAQPFRKLTPMWKKSTKL